MADTIRIKRLTQTATIPTKATDGAAGFDLYADNEGHLIIHAGQTRMLQTNVAFEIPAGYFGAVFASSGLSTKYGVRPANCVGVIDSDYRGSVGVPMHNDSQEDYLLRPHERVAQLVILPCPAFELEEVSELTETDRGTGGFGSTGDK